MTYGELKQAGRDGRASVHLHGFHQLVDGSQEYSDDPSLITGWAVYVRVATPEDPQQPFDVHELPDSATFDEAQQKARGAALTFLNNEEDWNHD